MITMLPVSVVWARPLVSDSDSRGKKTFCFFSVGGSSFEIASHLPFFLENNPWHLFI